MQPPFLNRNITTVEKRRRVGNLNIHVKCDHPRESNESIIVARLCAETIRSMETRMMILESRIQELEKQMLRLELKMDILEVKNLRSLPHIISNPPNINPEELFDG